MTSNSAAVPQIRRSMAPPSLRKLQDDAFSAAPQ
jgi:hypothetical protein